MPTPPFTLEHVAVGAGPGYWQVIDSRGYPVAQGSRSLCERAMAELGDGVPPEPEKPAPEPPVATGEQLSLI